MAGLELLQDVLIVAHAPGEANLVALGTERARTRRGGSRAGAASRGSGLGGSRLRSRLGGRSRLSRRVSSRRGRGLGSARSDNRGRASLAASRVALLAGDGGVIDVTVDMTVRGRKRVGGRGAEGDGQNGEGGECDKVEELGGHGAQRSERGG